MRFMIILKATARTEAGEMPTTEMFEAMGKYNEELVNAGVMLNGDGLHPSAKAVRVKFNGGETSVTKGPFDVNGLVSGFWIWRLNSMDEAIAWAKRAPFKNEELEIRQLFDAEDFGEEFTPELREQEKRLGERIARYAE